MAMNVYNYDPLTDFNKQLRRMQKRMWDESSGSELWNPQWQQGGGGLWKPNVDVRENDKCITLHADLPGVKREDLTIDVSEGNLIISGEKKEEKRKDNERYHMVERCYGKFTRQFALPEGINIIQTNVVECLLCFFFSSLLQE
jgi:HSP20 family molecular chaperone IbpA